jgi:hypothetical protein
VWWRYAFARYWCLAFGSQEWLHVDWDTRMMCQWQTALLDFRLLPWSSWELCSSALLWTSCGNIPEECSSVAALLVACVSYCEELQLLVRTLFISAQWNAKYPSVVQEDDVLLQYLRFPQYGYCWYCSSGMLRCVVGLTGPDVSRNFLSYYLDQPMHNISTVQSVS